MINGLMQIGIGVTDIDEAFQWYSHVLGFTTKVFDDTAEATLMSRYTGNKVYQRRALLIINPLGGAGIELWQFTNRVPEKFITRNSLDQQGINAIIVRVQNLKGSRVFFERKHPNLIVENREDTFVIQDPDGNLIELRESTYFIKPPTNIDNLIGGIEGVKVGFYNLEVIHSVLLLLGYHPQVESADNVILTIGVQSSGYAKLYGPSIVEITKVSSEAKSLFDNRYWGDIGYIHFCFEVENMNQLKEQLHKIGIDFTVDSMSSFQMEKSSGRFSYIEPEKNVLIEFVELNVVQEF